LHHDKICDLSPKALSALLDDIFGLDETSIVIDHDKQKATMTVTSHSRLDSCQPPTTTAVCCWKFRRVPDGFEQILNTGTTVRCRKFIDGGGNGHPVP